MPSEKEMVHIRMKLGTLYQGMKNHVRGKHCVLCRQAVQRKFLIATKLKADHKYLVIKYLGTCNLNIVTIIKRKKKKMLRSYDLSQLQKFLKQNIHVLVR